jgi:prephenate dehydrogenase
MWHDIAMANRGHLSAALELFIQSLCRFRQHLEQSDSPGVSEFFTQAKQRRDTWCERGFSPE